MVSYVTPKKNTEYIFYIGLPSQGTAGTFQSNPTIAAGDFKVSTDGGAEANPATLPAVTPAGSTSVKVTLSASEMNGDNITLTARDAAGSEWFDVKLNIPTSARQIDDLAWPTTTGRSIDVTAGGEVGIDWANIGSPTTTVNFSGTTIKTATDVETDTSEIGVAGAGLTNINLPNQTMDIVGNITGNLSGSVGSVTGNVGGAVLGDIGGSVFGTVNIGSSSVNLIWDDLTSGMTAAGSVGKLIADNLNATVSSRASQTSLDTVDDFLDTEIAAIKAKTDNLPTDPADASDIATATTAIAGYIDTEVASILSAVDTEVEAIKAKTDQLTFTTANRVDSQVFGMEAGTVTAAAIATNAIDADAIAADAVTEIQTGLSTLTAANIRTAVGLASANLDTQLDALPTANENADALLDRAAGVETGMTPRQSLRLMLAALVGKLSGAATTSIAIRDTNDTKDRIAATVDSDGNRSAVTLDAT